MKAEELYQKEFGNAESVPKESVIRLLKHFGKVLQMERNLVKNCNTPDVSASAFVEDCRDLATYVDGNKVDYRFRKFTIPVIEFNELRQAAKKYDSKHLR